MPCSTLILYSQAIPGDSRAYPPSLPFQEAVPTASVWRAYSDESGKYNADMVAQQRAKLNIILVFAGLFSAVVTAFIIQSSANLKPDYQKTASLLLWDHVNIQRAVANGTSIDALITSNTDPTAHFTPDHNDVVSYAVLWTSLALSLATAFFAILLDAWYFHYLWPIGKELKFCARTRHFGYANGVSGLIRGYIGLLQLLLHLSVIIFLYGLIIPFLDPV
ncbi:hypothetical protein IW261DRAFT_1344446, partial [Armillaria novae-zelandiae]